MPLSRCRRARTYSRPIQVPQSYQRPLNPFLHPQERSSPSIHAQLQLQISFQDTPLNNPLASRTTHGTLESGTHNTWNPGVKHTQHKTTYGKRQNFFLTAGTKRSSQALIKGAASSSPSLSHSASLGSEACLTLGALFGASYCHGTVDVSCKCSTKRFKFLKNVVIL